MAMLVLFPPTAGSGGDVGRSVLSARLSPPPSSRLPFSRPNPPLFSKSQPRLLYRGPRCFPSRLLASSDSGAGDPAASIRQVVAPLPPQGENVVVRLERPPVESKIKSLVQAGILAGGDITCILAFSAIGRFNHGFSILDIETLRTADPFIAGWILSSYLLGGYGKDGRGVNGYSKAIFTAAKSWVLGIPVLKAHT